MIISGPFAFDHVSLGVKTEDDLWELKDRINAADIWVSEVIDHGFFHSIYSFDPNGIPIEFSCNVEGIDIRKTPIMADKAPSTVAAAGPVLVATIIHRLLTDREKQAMLKKMNMVIGVFFGEVGTTLLKHFYAFDLNSDKIRKDLVVTTE